MFKAFDAAGVRPTVRMEIGNNEAIKHAVTGGLGLSVLSLHTLLMEGTDGPVAILDVKVFLSYVAGISFIQKEKSYHWWRRHFWILLLAQKQKFSNVCIRYGLN